VAGLTRGLDLRKLHECGLAFSTGQWHPNVSQIAINLPIVVNLLAGHGQKMEGMSPGTQCNLAF
jgi:hypothetical protein